MRVKALCGYVEFDWIMLICWELAASEEPEEEYDQLPSLENVSKYRRAKEEEVSAVYYKFIFEMKIPAAK